MRAVKTPTRPPVPPRPVTRHGPRPPRAPQLSAVPRSVPPLLRYRQVSSSPAATLGDTVSERTVFPGAASTGSILLTWAHSASGWLFPSRPGIQRAGVSGRRDAFRMPRRRSGRASPERTGQSWSPKGGVRSGPQEPAGPDVRQALPVAPRSGAYFAFLGKSFTPSRAHAMNDRRSSFAFLRSGLRRYIMWPLSYHAKRYRSLNSPPGCRWCIVYIALK